MNKPMSEKLMDPEKLFAYAIRALSARAYSEHTLKQKLLRKGSPDHVQGVLEKLQASGYINDAAYAESYARLYSGRWGAAKIKQHLLQKGVSSAVIAQTLEKLAPEGHPLAEATALLERYRSKHKGEKARAIRFLVGRGYGFSDAFAAWKVFTDLAQDAL
jgi:regulatory protein